MIAKLTPSRRASIAAAVARFASDSLVAGSDMEPEQSIMMTWAVSGGAPTGPSPVADTVTTASTIDAPTWRYSFWNTSVVKAAGSLMVVDLLVGHYGGGDVVGTALLEGE